MISNLYSLPAEDAYDYVRLCINTFSAVGNSTYISAPKGLGAGTEFLVLRSPLSIPCTQRPVPSAKSYVLGTRYSVLGSLPYVLSCVTVLLAFKNSIFAVSGLATLFAQV